jgi:APA family basic amino acid/polyamine antiporter
MSTTAEGRPSLFVRNATGLVRGWSGFDAFVYSFMSVNLVTLGMFYSLAVFAYVPDGSALAAVVLSAIAVTFLAITYAGLIAVMPRAGGDYVWQSRILDGIPGAVTGAVVGGVGGYVVGGALGLSTPGAIVLGLLALAAGVLIGLRRGGIAFVLSATGWWFILAQWAPIYGAILKLEFFQPLAALLGWTGALDFLGSADGTFVVSLIVIVLTSILVALGMAGYARVQKTCFWIALAGTAVMFILLAVASQSDFQTAFDRAAASLFGVQNAYQGTIQAAASVDQYSGGDLAPLSFGPGTWALIPFMMFWILYPNWGATLYGEVRGASDFRRVLNGMLAGIWITTVLAVVFLLLAAKTFGWTFFNAANVNFLNWFYGYTQTAPVVPIWAYPPLLAGFLVDNRLFQALLVIVFGAWFLGWSGTLFLSSTRMIFAAAFDRVLPEWAARISERRRVPWAALLLIMIPSIVVSWLYAYASGFAALTLDAALVIAVTFLGSAFAATILPWWKPQIYRNSPVARYTIAGLPLISVAGAITVLFLLWTLYEWLTNSLYGIGVGNSQSIIWLGVLYGVAAAVYVVARLVRRAQGIDLEAIHAEIPAE